MLIAGESKPTEDSGGDAAAAHAAFERVSSELSRWVGIRGYEALVSRALAESLDVYPALRGVHVQAQSEAYLSGIAETMDHYGAAQTEQALAALLEAILGLLSRLIGNDIVVTLVEMTMKNGTRGAVMTAPGTSTSGGQRRGQERA